MPASCIGSCVMSADGRAARHAEYEKMLIDEAIRRMRRLPPRDPRTWTLVSPMTRAERWIHAAFVALHHVRVWLRRRIRP